MTARVADTLGPVGETGGSGRRRRLDDISTRWSALRRPSREALDYLCRVYHEAIVNYLRGRLARGGFRPLTEQDAEDLLQEFYLRVGRTDWLTKPDPSRGGFRPFLKTALDYFLRERRQPAARRAVALPLQDGDGAAADVAAADPLDRRFDLEWRAATVKESMRLLARRSPAWATALGADLARGDATDADVARTLGWELDRYKSTLRRARAAFREIHPVVDRRLDGSSQRPTRAGRSDTRAVAEEPARTGERDASRSRGASSKR